MPTAWNLNTLFRTGIEILVLWVAIYAILRFLRNTRGFGMLRGLASFMLLSVILFQGLDYYPGVPTLEAILKVVGPALVLIVVILFQPELRQGMARVGRTGFLRMFSRNQSEDETVSRIAAACRRMAKERVGALIAFERGVSLAPFRDSGTLVDCPISGILLETIFFHGSPLHDGAVLIQGDKISAASCIFPLSTNPEIQRRLGTRHRAAIGLTEETDAIAMIVSEETGRISLASAGRLFEAIPYDLVEERLINLLRETRPEREQPEAEAVA